MSIAREREVRQWHGARIRHHDVWEVSVNLDESEGKLYKIGKTQALHAMFIRIESAHILPSSSTY